MTCNFAIPKHSPAVADGTAEAFTFDAESDGTPIFVRHWSPRHAGAARLAVLVIHGLGEYSGKDDPLGHYLAATGFHAYALDLRGHGQTAALAGTDDSAWQVMNSDIQQLVEGIGTSTSAAPLIAFGHSMGSLLTQSLMQTHGGMLAGAILCDTAGSSPILNDDRFQKLIAALRSARTGSEVDATTVFFAPLLSAFSGPFSMDTVGPAAPLPDHDTYWLSPFLNDITYSVVEGAEELWRTENETRIPRDLPMLIVAGVDQQGDHDKIASIRQLINRYVNQGQLALDYRLYPECQTDMIHDAHTKDRIHRHIGYWISQAVDR
jgi:alpha-beta hydrolase superfamily lysophospholipase